MAGRCIDLVGLFGVYREVDGLTLFSSFIGFLLSWRGCLLGAFGLDRFRGRYTVNVNITIIIYSTISISQASLLNGGVEFVDG